MYSSNIIYIYCKSLYNCSFLRDRIIKCFEYSCIRSNQRSICIPEHYLWRNHNNHNFFIIFALETSTLNYDFFLFTLETMQYIISISPFLSLKPLCNYYFSMFALETIMKFWFLHVCAYVVKERKVHLVRAQERRMTSGHCRYISEYAHGVHVWHNVTYCISRKFCGVVQLTYQQKAWNDVQCSDKCGKAHYVKQSVCYWRYTEDSVFWLVQMTLFVMT